MSCKVYMAGPLFTVAERDFNRRLAGKLEVEGFVVLLPQECGETNPEDIFKSDMRMLKASDVVLACMDGSDADSGTCWECGWAHAIGTPIVLYRTDFRSAGDAGKFPFNIMLCMSAHKIIDGFDPGSQVEESIDHIVRELVEFTRSQANLAVGEEK